MYRFKSLLILCSASALASVLAVHAEHANGTRLARRTTVTTSSTGTAGGYYYSLWMQDNGGATMNIGNGQYSLSWTSAAQDVVAGIGWNPGSAHVITYNGTFNPGGNSYLCVYGWTINPLIEYYICDCFGDYNPSTGLTYVGTVISDGAIYDIYKTVRTNAPSIEGTQTFLQIWSIRRTKRVGGNVTTSNHFNAWKSLGITLGSFNYQILATEGYQSTGSSSITLGSSGSTTPSTSSTTQPSSGGTVAHFGQCGGIGWTGETVCVSPYTCQVSSAYYSQCL